MKIALTGATGFIGRYIVRHLLDVGHELRCWRRSSSNIGLLAEHGSNVEWVEGSLGDETAAARLVAGCDGVIHAALWREGPGFRGAEGELGKFVSINVGGSLQLIDAAIRAGVPRFVFVSTCAVHEKILDDRPLDEAHPLWPLTHYGAHKAAIEKFVHSYGFGSGYPICAVRPTGVYGVAEPPSNSKWYGLVRQIVDNGDVEVSGGGKEVHAADVARACAVLLQANEAAITGEAFACYDRYVSQFEVAQLARELAGSTSTINGESKQPRHEIVTDKLQALGMKFGGEPLLKETVSRLVDFARSE